MLDGLLGRGFVPKGKSLIKLTKNRIDVLRRKRNATIKFLKKDLADLLANGLDVNAYGRAGGLLDELRHRWNLDFVEKSCDFVYKHLSAMQKVRECPEDCREAVSSLMFAASGFSELPELRDLRHMFHERYGDSLELYVNQEFVENLSAKPFSLEKKVKLLEDVASEFCIRWDSHAFEKRISTHNIAPVKDLNKSYGPPPASNKYKSINENKAVPKRDMYDISSRERFEGSNNGHSANEKNSDASERRGHMFQPAKQISVESQIEDPHRNHQNGHRRDQHGFSSKERSENVYNDCRSDGKDNETEKSEYRFQSWQEFSGKRHKPHFNKADALALRVKHDNFFQGNGHQNGTEHEPKKAEDVTSRAPKPISSSKRAEKFDFGFKQENFFQGYRPANCTEPMPQKLEDSPSRTPNPSSTCKTMENFDPGSRRRNGGENRENAIIARESRDGLLNARPEIISATNQSKSRHEDSFGVNNWVGEYDNAKSMRKLQEQDTDRPKPFVSNALPPPYVKPNGKTRNSKVEASAYLAAGSDGNAINKGFLGDKLEMAQVGWHDCVPGRANNHHDNMENHGRQDDAIEHSLPRRRSSRKKHSKSSSRDDTAYPQYPDIKRGSRNRRRENSRKGLQVLFEDDHREKDEERIIDKLLMHYSRKPTCYEEIKMKRESGSDDMSKITSQPRSLSLPKEHNEPSATTKVFTRAASFQPYGSSKARHVHPNLPDYDDLAARFAALKGR